MLATASGVGVGLEPVEYPLDAERRDRHSVESAPRQIVLQKSPPTRQSMSDFRYAISYGPVWPPVRRNGTGPDPTQIWMLQAERASLPVRRSSASSPPSHESWQVRRIKELDLND